MASTPPRPLVVLRLGKLIAMALAGHDLTENQYRALAFIDEGDVDPAEMSVRLVMKRPNLTTLLDGLERRGLVERTRRTEDRRRIELRLTPSGSSLLDDATRSANDALTRLARLGAGPAHDRLAGLDTWAEAVEEAAAILRASSGDAS
ncbi:MAG: MarR family transcriptional regulator [Microthrixaceae bacterium]